jgi:hypothetical protein
MRNNEDFDFEEDELFEELDPELAHEVETALSKYKKDKASKKIKKFRGD